MDFTSIEIVKAMLIILAGSTAGFYLIDTAASLITSGRQ